MEQANEVFPFSYEFQRNLLSILIKDPTLLSVYLNEIRTDYFTYEQFKIIWKILSIYYSNYQELPTTTIFQEELKKILQDELEIAFYLSEINELISNDVENKDYIIHQVEEFIRFQKIKNVINYIIEKLSSGSLNYHSIASMLREAMVIGTSIDMIDYKDTNRLSLNKDPEKIPTGYAHLDSRLGGGVPRGEIAVVGAYTGIGKTLWLINLALNLLIKGYKTIYITLEQAAREIIKRIDNAYFVSLGDYDGVMDMGNAAMLLSKLPGTLYLKEYTTTKFGVEELNTLLCKLKFLKGFTPDVVIIDYATLMKVNAKERWLSVGENFRILRDIAVENNIVVWTAAQLHREGKRTQHKTSRRILSDELIYYVRDSSIIAEICDKFFILEKEDKKKANNEDIIDYTLTLAKTRAGNEGAKIKFILKHQRLEESIEQT